MCVLREQLILTLPSSLYPRPDNDGIKNSVDLDDDNDGILDVDEEERP